MMMCVTAVQKACAHSPVVLCWWSCSDVRGLRWLLTDTDTPSSEPVLRGALWETYTPGVDPDTCEYMPMSRHLSCVKQMNVFYNTVQSQIKFSGLCTEFLTGMGNKLLYSTVVTIRTSCFDK